MSLVGAAREGSFEYHGWYRSLIRTGHPCPHRLNVWTTCCKSHSERLPRTFCGNVKDRRAVCTRVGGRRLVVPRNRLDDRGNPTCFGPLTSLQVDLEPEPPLMMTAMRSPTTPRSDLSSPRQKFDSEMLKAYMKKLLPATLQSSAWPSTKDRDQVKLWIKEIGERVKERMLGT